MPFSTRWGWWKPQQEVKVRWCERISCIIKGVCTIRLCISRFLSEKVYSTWTREIGIEAHRQILEGHLAPNSKFGKERSMRRIIQKCAPHERGSCAPKFRERSHEETLHQERCARKAAWDLAKIIYLYSYWSKGDASTYFNETRGARICCWFRSINAHDEQKRTKLKRDGHSKRSRTPTVVLTASANPRGGTSVRSRSQSVRNRAVLDEAACSPIATDTPMSGSAVKKPRLTKEVKSIICKTVNFVSLVVPRLSTISECSSSSASLSQDSLRRDAAQAPRELVHPGGPGATCFKFIFKFSIRAKWWTGIQETGTIPKIPKPI